VFIIILHYLNYNDARKGIGGILKRKLSRKIFHEK
jgi:hypothetical protein